MRLYLFLAALVLLSACTQQTGPAAKFDIAEVLDVTCSTDQECTTPDSYLVRSNCPYTSKCIEGACAVVCPKFDGEKYPQVRECGECPMFSPPGPEFCKDGTLVAGGTDDCGCQMPPSCEPADNPIVCTTDARICPDGSSVGRVGPDCEFASCPSGKLKANECPADRPEACTMEYSPVCGWLKQEVECDKAPCADTYGNSCTACADPDVAYWTAGECPEN